MLKNYKKRTEGFTIIEVLIVLAIAGLIILIVLLAVPALQRNTRNTGRKEDAGRIATAVNDYVSNNGGALPLNAGWNTATGSCNAILTDAGTLNQYNTTANPEICTTNTGTIASPVAYNFYEADNSTGTGLNGAALGAAAANVLILSDQTVCSGGTSTTTTGANNRNAALLFAVEAGSSWAWNCDNIQ